MIIASQVSFFLSKKFYAALIWLDRTENKLEGFGLSEWPVKVRPVTCPKSIACPVERGPTNHSEEAGNESFGEDGSGYPYRLSDLALSGLVKSDLV